MEIADNVNKFESRVSRVVGNWEGFGFSMSMWNEWEELNISSPIEQILYVALHAVLRFEYLPLADADRVDGVDISRGTGVWPQHKIGNYRVDFLITHCTYIRGKQKRKELIVECDSQEFHERTEKERRYEKKRNRILIQNGYKVFHYTGAEIVKNSFKIAAEILSEVCGYKIDYGNIENILLEYEKID